MRYLLPIHRDMCLRIAADIPKSIARPHLIRKKKQEKLPLDTCANHVEEEAVVVVVQFFYPCNSHLFSVLICFQNHHLPPPPSRKIFLGEYVVS